MLDATTLGDFGSLRRIHRPFSSVSTKPGALRGRQPVGSGSPDLPVIPRSERRLVSVDSSVDTDIVPLFPPNTTITRDGTLAVGGCRLDDLAREFGTPTFVVDESGLRSQARAFAQGLDGRRPGSQVAFASKSFPARAIYRLMADEGLLIDVAGGGELVMALDADVAPESIVLHGNAKTDSELTMALDAGVGTIVIDSLPEIERIESLAAASTRVMLRVQPGVDPRTQAAISTGHRGSKFGVRLEQVAEAVTAISRSRHLELEGIHLHLGSQMLDLNPWVEAIKVISGLGTFDVYDVGGGLGVRYTRAETAPTVDDYLDTLVQAAADYLPDSARLIIEPGRALVARSTSTIYRVVTVKPGDPTFVAVDGGMADNFEASTYFGQPFDATVVTRLGGQTLVNVVGRQCESGDQLAPQVLLDEPAVGDVIALPMTGAYTHTLANNYNGALRPAIVFVRDGQAHPVVRRDTYADLLARELPWP